MKKLSILGLVLFCTLAGSAFAQQKIYNWVQASDEVVRLDPAFYQSTRVYNPGLSGMTIHLDLQAEKPVTIAVTHVTEWDTVRDHPETVYTLHYFCVREHVTQINYGCDLPPSDTPMTLVIRDERGRVEQAISGAAVNGQAGEISRAVAAGIDTVLSVHNARQFASPNNVQLTYYRWACVQNCFPPEFRSFRLAKEKYELTPLLKVYSLPVAQHDGDQISWKLKSPVPMLVAVLPLDIAGQLHEKPEMLESAVAQSVCQQRAVQSSRLTCTFNVKDGAQSLIVLPEPSVQLPTHKKAEIEVTAEKCVANCVPGSN